MTLDNAEHSRVEKIKNGPCDGLFPFKLEVVTVGMFGDVDPPTSCVVEHVEEAPVNGQHNGHRKLGAVEQIVVDAHADLRPIDGGPVQVDELIAESVRRLPRDPEKRDRRRDIATRAMQKLSAKEIFEVNEDAIFCK